MAATNTEASVAHKSLMRQQKSTPHGCVGGGRFGSHNIEAVAAPAT